MPYTKFKPKRFASNRSGRSGSSKSGSRKPKKDYINPARFIQSAKPVDAAVYEPVHTFADFAAHPLLQRNLRAMGFTVPSPIQDQSIPAGLTGQDIVGLADTGTGKTAAFAVPLLHKLLTNRDARAIIMAPTRELALQINEACREIAKGGNVRSAILIGGVAMGPQLRDLRANPQLIIGTPGRIKDHIERGTLRPSTLNIAVLDEVDRMLDMGFVNDIRRILAETAEQKQLFFFSATLDARVRAIINDFSANPVYIEVKSNAGSENVEQNIINYGDRDEKVGKLHDLLSQAPVVKTLVFDDTQRSVERLCKQLQSRGIEADAIHGGKSQSQRQRALKRFRDNQVRVLVATDVAARGIDVADITHVVNYSTPQSYSDYIHRIGRAGRAGRAGHALTFIEKT